ncbi:hypothetical protein [Chachezhania sediminis]|uniref:hypothetical protein n=1 Tax=Chachezhania sediminis TaxID=2599291 RepID=UPI0018EF1650|nr:hypothetical protein [Chachezhania sediminis]
MSAKTTRASLMHSLAFGLLVSTQVLPGVAQAGGHGGRMNMSSGSFHGHSESSSSGWNVRWHGHIPYGPGPVRPPHDRPGHHPAHHNPPSPDHPWHRPHPPYGPGPGHYGPPPYYPFPPHYPHPRYPYGPPPGPYWHGYDRANSDFWMGAAAGALAAMAIGSIVDAPPPDCVDRTINGVDYLQCGNTWLRAVMNGHKVTYQIVAVP